MLRSMSDGRPVRHQRASAFSILVDALRVSLSNAEAVYWNWRARVMSDIRAHVRTEAVEQRTSLK